MTLRFVLAMVLALAAASPASAATVLLSDDAEGAIEDKWVVDKTTNPKIQPWQKSDSTTPKVHGNKANGGATSYWAGIAATDNDPVEVIEGVATLTTKAPIIVPADGQTTISLFSFFQNEGDDQGLVEVAINTGGKLTWKKLTEYKLEPNAAGDMGKKGYCNPTDPVTTVTQEFEEVKGNFSAFAGKSVFVRLNMKYGGENRSATQACGWYVDDIKMETTGTPGNAGVAPTTPPAITPAPALGAKSSVKLASLKGKGKKASVKTTVSGGAIGNVVLTLFQGKKKVHVFRAKGIPVGTRTITFKTKKKLKKGALTIKLTGVGADGKPVRASTKGKAR